MHDLTITGQIKFMAEVILQTESRTCLSCLEQPGIGKRPVIEDSI